ncbi:MULTISPECIES: TssA family type VI secretion system protein [Snodgrassella]|uniref:TssA family type VI secretion system protein n=1 Tax=Snodgrassella TaxID=1193515 RepID=UPI00081579C1|nr:MULTISPECIES: TssA family type VI secretion system protein [Snodgrassella]SCC17644.1 type VI secretion system protein VasJ [Snodgrassella sp. R-53583]
MQISAALKILQRRKIYEDVKPLWEEIEYLLAPVDGEPEDVNHHDSFLDIRQELEKVSDIQLGKIEDAAYYLCQNVGKDIRVVVYLTYALFRREAFRGLIKGLLLLYGVQAIYPSSFQPQRISVIKTMLRWLGGAKMEDAFLLCQDTLLPNEHQAITVLCELIQENLATQFKVTIDELAGLLGLLPVLSGESQTLTASQATSTFAANSANEVVSVANDEVILCSSQDLMQTMKSVGQFIADKEQKEYASYRLLRQFRWDLLERLPLHQDGMTKIVPPRQELVNHLQTLYQRKDWSGLLAQCHAGFMEASNHFYFDLQFFCWTAMQHLAPEANVWADMLCSDMAFLLTRLTGLETLTFNNGQPFASGEVLDWIAVHARFQQQNIEEIQLSSSCELTSMNDIDAQAFVILAEQGFDKTMEWLATVQFEDGLEQLYYKQFLLARLAIKGGKTDFALSLLEKLNLPFSQQPLFEWNKKLTFQIKQELLRLLQQKFLTIKGSGKEFVSGQIEELKKELVLLNPFLAHQLLYR